MPNDRPVRTQRVCLICLHKSACFALLDPPAQINILTWHTVTLPSCSHALPAVCVCWVGRQARLSGAPTRVRRTAAHCRYVPCLLLHHAPVLVEVEIQVAHPRLVRLQVCRRRFCRQCCKRYLAIETDPVNQGKVACLHMLSCLACRPLCCLCMRMRHPSSWTLVPPSCLLTGHHCAVQTCNECFLEHVAWDPKRTYDEYGPEGGKPVVLVHGALVGRQCMLLEARALADAGYR